jgi:hypothetical protein
MKKLISTVLFAVFGFVMISCDVFTTENPDDNPDKNPNQMHEIEALCNDFNVDMKILETLVNSIQTRDTVSQFSPLVEDGEEVGYIVTFVNAGTVIIRYGANSEYVPKLGFKCDDSDEYFWTIDGEWLLDDNGNKVPASGASAVVPQFKVEENYWCISFDGGENWIRLDKTIDDEQTINQIRIKNFVVRKAPVKGTLKVLRPTGELPNLYTYSEQNYIKDGITYIGAAIDDLKSLEISNNGGVIGFRVALEDLGNFVSNENIEVTYDGKLLSNISFLIFSFNFNNNSCSLETSFAYNNSLCALYNNTSIISLFIKY